MGPEITRSEFKDAFVKLLRDPEAEVRTAAASHVDAVCELLNSDDVINSVMPCIKELVTDSSQHVRAALASVVMCLAPILGKEQTIDSLLDIFLQLLKDEV